jgi:hypothetical protein
MPPSLFVVLTPRDDVRGPGVDLLVASGTAVRLDGPGRLNRAHLPAGWRADDEVAAERGAVFLVGLAASAWVRAPGRHASAPPSITIEAPVT